MHGVKEWTKNIFIEQQSDPNKIILLVEPFPKVHWTLKEKN